jgi:DNA-directed RNA polymerase specialized sigma subunit
MASESTAEHPDRARFVATMHAALSAAIGALAPRDRLRLACYYAQEMTLAQIGKLTSEHESTVSRQLTRTRRAIREAVERRLKDEHRFSAAEIDECFESIVDDAGQLDIGDWLEGPSKKSASGRSIYEDPS